MHFDERRELLNRIQHPEFIVQKPELVEGMTKEMPMDNELPPDAAEYAAVGMVDPHLERGDEDNG